LTDTVRVAGAVALNGATISHVEFELALKFVAVAELLTLTVCDAGAAPPCVWENDNEVGVAVIVDEPPVTTVSVTGTEAVAVPAVTVTEPWYVPALSPDVLTDTVRVAGVLPLAGVTVNHVEFVLTLVVKVAAPPEPVIWTVWDAGAAPPMVCENDNEVGEAVSVGPPVTVSVTGTEAVAVPELIVMDPW
jgi:hypothetical protein